MRLNFDKHFKIKNSDRNFTQCFDVLMTSLSSDKKITVQQCYICSERCDCSLTYLFKQITKSDYVSLLGQASINDTSKFAPVSLHRPKMKGRPLKHYHPLLQKEKHLDSVVPKILPKEIANSVCQKGSCLAHLYGLPKTHKEKLSMRPILSATGTYNYALAKWLDEKLKPLSVNRYTISDTFAFQKRFKT